MSSQADRLAALRAQLTADELDGFVVPLTDEHMSEYVGSYAQRLAWLTGFDGSAGAAVVLADKAAMFVDGRYTTQVRDQVDGAHWSFEEVPQTSIAEWLSVHAPAGGRIGYDPWLHTCEWVTKVTGALADRDAALVAVTCNPIDAIWRDRPEPSRARLIVHGEEHAGKLSAAKRQEMAEWLAGQKADAAVLASLDSIAWTFNIRGADVARTPVGLAFALVQADGTADLFVAGEKVGDDLRQHLGNGVRLHERVAFEDHLRSFAGKRVAVDPERSVSAIAAALEAGGARVVAKRDPSVLPKAIKNAVEIAGHKAAQARDGAALVRFLHWLAVEAPKGGVDELGAQTKLQEFREASGMLRDLSFDTISGAGPNGALIHYRASEQTNRILEQGSLYLVDSGAQYADGTTDVTRTVAIGAPTAEMRDRFTRVLKGHIALSTARFPEGTRGSQLDSFARRPLWEAGLDYAHGTGHGVGSFLSVHEGPQRIGAANYPGSGWDEPLAPGMILSNEPGYYKVGAFGIRIENLVLVTPVEVDGAEKPMLGFETLTFAPVDRTLIDANMLSDAETRWVNGYHTNVVKVVGPQLDADARIWLQQQCAGLDYQNRPARPMAPARSAGINDADAP